MKYRPYGKHLGTQVRSFCEAMRIDDELRAYNSIAARRPRTDEQIVFGRRLRDLRVLGKQPSYHCIICGEAHDNDADEDLCRSCARLDCCATCEHYDRDNSECRASVPAWVIAPNDNICDPEDGSACECWERR